LVDAGEARPLADNGKSLLPNGARDFEDLFAAGDAVTTVTSDGGAELGVELVSFSSPYYEFG
jgi:glutamate 5-kinase